MRADRGGSRPSRPPRVVARSCVACRRTDEQGSLVRFAASPEGRLVVDHPPKLKGRGAYLCPDPACVAQAARRNPFSRAFRRPVALPEGDLRAVMTERIAAHVTGLLGVARQAGRIRSGAAQVEEALGRRHVRLLLLAEDAEASTAGTFTGRAARADVPVARFASRDRLGRAIGEEFRAVVGVTDLGLAAAIADDLGKLRGLAGTESGEIPGR